MKQEWKGALRFWRGPVRTLSGRPLLGKLAALTALAAGAAFPLVLGAIESLTQSTF